MAEALWWMIPVTLGGMILVLAFLWRPLRNSMREAELGKLRQDFHREREHLEARFLTRAASSGKPRGLVWLDCDFNDDVVYARDRRTGEISALVGVTISFDALPGGGMEEVEFVRAPRDATAVFKVDGGGKWITEGRAIMNLNPTEAVRHFQDNLELVGKEIAARS